MADKKEEKKFSRKEVVIENINWISAFPKIGKKYQARIRYRQPLEECEVISIADKNKSVDKILLSQKSVLVSFKNPQRAVTPGQSLVIYDGEEMMGEELFQSKI